MKNKTRDKKQQDYAAKYGEIPIDFYDRLAWMYDIYHMTDKKAQSILNNRIQMLNNLYYTELRVILFEEPEGYKRPRFRLVNRYNLVNEAVSNSNFVHVYSIDGAQDRAYMKRLIESDLVNIQGLILTPCDIEYNAYLKTPTYYNTEQKFLAEAGYTRPVGVDPDWDNIGKKYSDMYNSNVWFDDNLVIDGAIHKYYSILPRIEIRLLFLNMYYNKYQYANMTKRTGSDNITYFRSDI